MQELYELVGLGWRLPVFVKWLDAGQAEVRLAEIPLLKKQTETALATLRQYSHHHEGPIWFCSTKGLEQCAFKSAHTDPEEIVIWKRTEHESAVQADFALAYCSSRDAVVRDPVMFAGYWDSICKFMLEWLLFHDGTVDFGFAKLDGFCLRVDWKHSVTHRMWALVNGGHHPSPNAMRKAIDQMFQRSYLTAYDEESDTFRWSLEITPTENFHHGARLAEMQRKRDDPGNYFARFLARLIDQRHKDRLYAIQQTYAAQTNFPHATLPHWAANFAKGSRKKTVDPDSNHRSPRLAAHLANTKRSRRALVRKNAALLSVPDLQSFAEDLWNGRPAVDPTWQNPDGTARVPLWPAIKEWPCDKLLALRSDRGNDGLAASPQLVPDHEGAGA